MKVQQLNATVYSNTGFINVKSLKHNMCYQGYSSPNFIHINPMRDEKEAGDSLQNFIHNVGAPAEIITDSAPLLQGRDSNFAKTARFFCCNLGACELGT